MSFSLVSVIIASYNRSNYLRQAIASVVAQTYRPIELIVVDDGSTEPLESVVHEFVTDDALQLVYIRQENSGPASARNHGLKVARGEFIGFLDSDDLWFPEMLSSSVDFLLTHHETDIVCGGWDMIDEAGKASTGVFLPSGLQKIIDADFTKALILKNLFPIHSVLTRRECFDRCGKFNVNLTAYEDWELWVRMAAFGVRLSFIDVPVAHWRVHNQTQRSDLKISWDEHPIPMVVESLFTCKEIANCCYNLKAGAEIRLWLQLGRRYSYQKMLSENAFDAFSKAEEMLKSTSFNIELYSVYEQITANIPIANNFRMALQAWIPATVKKSFEADKQWGIFKKQLHERSLLTALKALMKVMANNPIWLAKFLMK